MKKTKVIIPALGLLLLSTAASVTGTVAWFAANTTVTANGMTVTVKSDSTFLLIAAGHQDLATVRSGKKTTDAASNASAALYPCAHNTVSGIESADTVGNWYYKTSDDPSLYGGAGHESEPTALTAFTNYVLINEFSLAIAEGGNGMSNIKVDSCTITKTGGDDAVKVLVASSTTNEEFAGTGGASNRENPVTLQSSLANDAVMYVKVYVYWDGEDADVTTNGIADLTSTAVVVNFTGSVVTA